GGGRAVFLRRGHDGLFERRNGVLLQASARFLFRRAAAFLLLRAGAGSGFGRLLLPPALGLLLFPPDALGFRRALGRLFLRLLQIAAQALAFQQHGLHVFHPLLLALQRALGQEPGKRLGVDAEPRLADRAPP